MSFRKSLLLSLILFATLPITVVSLISVSLSVSIIKASRQESLANLAYSNGSSLDSFLSVQKREIELMSKNYDIIQLVDFYNELGINNTNSTITSDYYVYSTNVFLEKWVKSATFYEDAVVVDLVGDVIASSTSDYMGMSIVDESYFIDTITSKNTIIGNVLNTSLNPNKKIIPISHVIETGQLECAGILILFVSVDFFNEFTNNISLEDTGIAYLIDGNNSTLIHPSRNNIKTIDINTIKEIKSNSNFNNEQKFVTTLHQTKDTNQIISYYLLNGLNWLLIVQQDYDEILSSSNIILVVSIIASTISLIISIIAGTFLAKSFTIPILKLKESFFLAAKAKEYVFCKIESKNEFGSLAESYNIMITELDENYTLLQAEKEKTEYMAYHNLTTGLINRTGFEEELNKFINKEVYGSVLYIDLDNFKYVNDVFGHHYGDLLLKEFTMILCDSDFNWHVTASVGGDEFLTLKFGSETEIEQTVQKLLSVFEKPFIINNVHIYVTASIGLCHITPETNNMNTIIKNADIAMYKAKELGKNTYRFYSTDMHDVLIRHNQILDVLRNCIEYKEIFLVYQPEVSILNNKILSFECLMRLNNKELGFISPTEFIPIAESSGLILQLGNYALKTACTFAKQMYDDNIEFGFLSVNVSSIQLMQKDFVETVINVLKDTKLDSKYLLLEITESLLINSIDSNIQKLSALREFGIGVALDDFGTGYSSLNYLVNLPIDYVKIDKSFIDDICNDARKQAICKSIIDMSHSLNLEIIAEGIEHVDQCNLLQEMGADLYQGYYFSRPVEDSLVVEMLKGQVNSKY